MDALGPLRARAAQLTAAAQREKAGALHTYETSARPALKEQAASLKESLVILMQEEEALKERIASLATHALATDPSVHTGFNVITAGRKRADGQSFSTEELRTERQRLIDMLEVLGRQVEQAKAEITRQGRREDQEIWETQLVALQDTKRVYRDEINLIEVELLGREHSERIAAERAAAEASGSAQLQRLQEQLLQTRVKYNRAKYQYYYPGVKGYNINFGGGGIFGACKNIDISEINGYVTVRGETGAMAADGTVTKPARLTVQFEAPGAHRQQQQQGAAATGGNKSPIRSKTSQFSPSSSTRTSMRYNPDAAAGAGASGPDNLQQQGGQGGPSPATPVRAAPNAALRSSSARAPQNQQQQAQLQRAAQSVPASPVQLPPRPPTQQQQRQAAAAGDREDATPTTSARLPSVRTNKSGASLESSNSGQLLEAAAQQALQQQQAQAQQTPLGRKLPQPTSPGKGGNKGKNAALRFLSRIGSKKDKYQSKGRGQDMLQPAPTEDMELAASGMSMEGGPGEKKKLRTLAGKLLSRKSAKAGAGGGGGMEASSSAGSLDKLAFGGHQLTKRGQDGRVSRKGSGLLGESIDEEASHHSDLLLDDENSTDAGQQENGYSRDNPAAEVHDEGDGSLASDDDFDYSDDGEDDGGSVLGRRGESTLTRDTLQQRQQHAAAAAGMGSALSGSSTFQLQGAGSLGATSFDLLSTAKSASSRGGSSSWLRGARSGGSMGGGGDAGSALEDGSSVVSLGEMGGSAAEDDSLPTGPSKQGVFVSGRMNDFELTGEKGTKCPNLSIGQADIKANVFVRFVFQYDKTDGAWHQAEKPQFDVQHLTYKLKGNNVPMPSTLVKHLLKVFIPEIIQRRLLPLFPKEFGDYMLTAQRGFEATADVAVAGPSLKTLDADLAFEVRGPARSAKEARKQQQKYAAAKEARSMLGLSLPQAQVLAELFGGKAAMLDPPRPATIKQLIAFQAFWDRHPHLYDQVCQVWNTAYQLVAQRQRGMGGEFCFRSFMDGPVARVRRKPARARVIMRTLDVGVNADGVVNMLHDYTQRTLEELFIKGPIANTRDNPEFQQESLEEQRELLRAWHSWVLRELDLFKSKFRGATATLLGAGDCRGFSLGVENAMYEGPLRLRVPVAMQLDRDGAFSFELPLPSPEGNLSVFVDGFKSLVIPSHLRPPAPAINWIPLTGDPAVDEAMQKQVSGALEAIRGVLAELAERIAEQGLEAEDAEADKVLSHPRTKVGNRLGRCIVNRLKVRVRLDERRIGEILQGIDSQSMGSAFVSTAGRLLGHLGDVMTLGFTPVAQSGGDAAEGPPSQYLFQFESSDISRLRADVQSLGFVSLVSPGGMVRLAHAVVKNFLLAFKGATPETLEPLEERFRTWYTNMSRAALDISVCVDGRAALENGQCLVRLSGSADDGALRETSPLILVNDLDLVTLGKAMRGDPPASASAAAAAQQHAHGNGTGGVPRR